jgi:hypothetical protein
MHDARVLVEESIMRIPIYVLAIAAIFACGEKQYVYTPQTANTTSAGMPAARTPIPQERPQGAVEITSYGVTDFQPGDTRVPALHVRMVVTNDGDDTPWRLDTRQQLVEIPGEGRSGPMFVNTDVQTPPLVTIARTERRVLDLYYPLPATIDEAEELPRFEMLWQVDTAARTVASRTSFDRVAPEPPTQVVYGTAWPYWAGYGPHWWYDPFYPRTVFIHTRPIVIHDHRRPVVGRFDGRFRPGGATVVRRGPRR